MRPTTDPTELDLDPQAATIAAIETCARSAGFRRGFAFGQISIVLGAALGFGLGFGLGCILSAMIGTARAETIDGDRITMIDGDTVALPCDPARGIYPGCSEHLRLVGIDAPETYRARCDDEREAGYRAKGRLGELIRGHRVEITRTGRDRYGRTLAHLATEAGDVETPMLADGLAIPYAPGRAAWAERCRHWCPGAPRCEE